MTANKATESDNYRTYHDGAIYTIYFTLGNYIPAGGTLKLSIPSDIKLISSPFDNFESSNPNLVPSGSYNDNEITYNANNQVDAGDVTLKFGGIRNPRSFAATDLFEMFSYDSLGNIVADG